MCLQCWLDSIDELIGMHTCLLTVMAQFFDSLIACCGHSASFIGGFAVGHDRQIDLVNILKNTLVSVIEVCICYHVIALFAKTIPTPVKVSASSF